MNFQPPSRGGRPEKATWPLTVVATHDVTPRMRRVSLVGEDMSAFAYRPGQDLVLALPQPGEAARRHYTIRAFDPVEQRLEIDVVMHGDNPGPAWARNARIGDTLEAVGPRGRTSLNAAADWHLFVGDETALPGIFAMAETLPAKARAWAILEIQDAGEEQPLEGAAQIQVRWLHRGGPIKPHSQALIDAVAAFEIPEGVGQLYLLGETSTVRAQRQGLIARGFSKMQITAEGYWRPGRVGGHDHVFDAETLAHMAVAKAFRRREGVR